MFRWSWFGHLTPPPYVCLTQNVKIFHKYRIFNLFNSWKIQTKWPWQIGNKKSNDPLKNPFPVWWCHFFSRISCPVMRKQNMSTALKTQLLCILNSKCLLVHAFAIRNNRKSIKIYLFHHAQGGSQRHMLKNAKIPLLPVIGSGFQFVKWMVTVHQFLGT